MFFENYCRLCKSVNMSPTALAIKVGLSRAAVSNWKNEGRIPNVVQLQKIAQYFNVSIDELLGNNKKPSIDFQDDERLQEIFNCYYELNENGKDSLLAHAKLHTNMLEYKKCDLDAQAGVG